MNLSALRDRVYAHLRDEDHEFFLTDEVEGWLNDAQQDLAARLKTIRREVTESTTAISNGDGTIDKPTDFLEPLSLRFGEDDAEFVDDDVFWSHQDSGETPDHTLARIYGAFIETYPEIADAEAYRLRYIALGTTMSDDDDEPEIAVQWHVRLTYYALAQAWAKKDEVGQSDRWLSRYEDGLPPLSKGRDTGPITLAPIPGPFDVDPGAMHI